MSHPPIVVEIDCLVPLHRAASDLSTLRRLIPGARQEPTPEALELQEQLSEVDGVVDTMLSSTRHRCLVVELLPYIHVPTAEEEIRRIVSRVDKDHYGVTVANTQLIAA